MEDGISRVVIIGAGQMGPGIAVPTTLAGCQTTLVGRTAESVARGRERFDAALAFMVEHGVVTSSAASEATARLICTTDRGRRLWLTWLSRPSSSTCPPSRRSSASWTRSARQP